MKKLYRALGLALLLLIAVPALGQAQQCASCPPDTSGTGAQAGIYPFPPPPAFVDQGYNETANFVLPNDTVASGNNVKIKKLVIDSITNRPPGLDWSSQDSAFSDFDNNLNGSVGPVGCIRFCGTPTQVTQLSDSMTIHATIVVFVFGGNAIRKEDFKFKAEVYGPNSMQAQPLAQSSYCHNSPINFSFDVIEEFRSGNQFKLELYDSAKGVSLFLDSISAVDTGTYSFNATLPDTLSGGSGYKLRAVATAPDTIGQSTAPFTVLSPLSLSASGTDPTCQQSNGQITVSGSGGQSPYSYRLNSGAFQASGTFSNLSPGTYTVTLKDQNGCTVDTTLTLNNQGTPPSLSLNPTDPSCNGAADGQILASAGGGSSPYDFSLNNGPFQSSGTFGSLSSGSYTIVVQDQNACKDTQSQTLTAPAALSFSATSSNISCNGGSDGSITLNASGGTPAYQYKLGSGSFQNSDEFTGLSAGSYTAYLRDANGCEDTLAVTLDEPAPLTASASKQAVGCNGAADGQVTLAASGGTPPYEYRFDGGTFQSGQVFSGLSGGSFSYTVRDDQGCTTSGSVTVTEPPALALSLSPTHISCNGAADGSVKASASGGNGGYSYQLDGGSFQSDSSFGNIGPGSHTLTLKDSKGCTISQSFSISQPAPLAASANTDSASCSGASDGAISLSASGGTAPYSYRLNSGSYQSNNQFSGLTSGSYTFTVQDDSGCTTTGNLSIGAPAPLSLSSSVSDVSCNGAADGSINLSASGGTTPYEFKLGTGSYQTSSTFGGLSGGTFTVTVRDKNGCTTQQTLTVNEPAALSLATNVTPVACNGGSSGQIQVNASGGTMPYEYQLDGAGFKSSNTFGGLTQGSYTVTVKDANACTNSSTISISEPAPLSVGLSKSMPACYGQANGSVALTASGGNGGYQYSLDGGIFQSNGTFTSLAAGSYSYTVKDSKGCQQTGSFSLSQPDSLQLNPTIQPISCNGAGDGKLTGNPAGGTTPYQYRLNSGSFQNNNSLSGLAPGSYTYTVQDAKGCQKTTSFSLTQPQPLLANAGKQNATPGLQDGKAFAAPSGGTMPYSYSWNTSPVQTGDTIAGLAPGYYAVTVTDQNSCTAQDTVRIVEQLVLSATTTDATCGNNDGQIEGNTQGGVAPITFSLNSGAFGSDSVFKNLDGGSYTLVAKDSLGNTDTVNAAVNDQSAPSISTSPSNITCKGAADGSITISASGGTPPLSYSIDGSSYQSNNTFANLSAGNYTAYVKDANGCIRTASLQLTAPAPLTLATTAQDISCNGAADGKITANAGGGTPAYQYRLNGGTYSNQQVFDSLAPGSYTVDVQDANGCTNSGNVTIAEPAPLSLSLTIQAPLCYADSNGQLQANPSGGTSPYQFRLNGGPYQASNTFDSLAAGSYTMQVQDAQGCTNQGDTLLTEPDSLQMTVAASSISCSGANDGRIEITASGGTSPYDYRLNSGSFQPDSNFTALAPGAYEVETSDANDCRVRDSLTVTEPAPLSLSLSPSDVSCAGAGDGNIQASVTGGTKPYSFALNSGAAQADSSFANLGPGEYAVTVTDDSSCTRTDSITITAPDSLQASVNLSDVSCKGGTDGALNASVSGGTKPYSYSLNGGTPQSDSSFSGLSAGNYTLLITDANGCSRTIDTALSDPAALSLSLTGQDVSCNGAADGQIAVSASGGSGGYLFALNGGSYMSVDTFQNLGGGSYSVTVLDGNGCTVTKSISLAEPSPLALTATAQDLSCFKSGDGKIIASGSGGTQPYSYSLNGGSFQLNGTFPNLSAGNYTLTLRDSNGCSQTQNYTLNEPSPLSASLSKNNVSCAGGSDGSIAATPVGGTASYEYSLNGGTFQSSNSYTGLPAGTYSLKVRDANGCTFTPSITLSAPPALTASINSQAVSCFGGSDGSLTINASGGTQPWDYKLTNTSYQSNNQFSGLSAQNYSVTVRDDQGCTASFSATVGQPDSLQLSLTKINSACAGASNGEITASPQDGTPPYQYSLNGGAFQSNNVFSGLAPGSYTVTVKDDQGCSKQQSVTITEPAPLSVTTGRQFTAPGQANGRAYATATGGNGGYNYQWGTSPVQNSDTATGLSAGFYTVTVTDFEGCSVKDTVRIRERLLASASTTAATCGNANGGITVNVSGGVNPFEYKLASTSFQAGNSFSGLSSGAYTVIVRDSLSQTDTLSVGVPDQGAAALSVSTTAPQCPGDTSGQITASAAGGTAPYEFALDGGAYQSNNQFTNLSGGNYTLYVKDANGCINTDTATLPAPPPITLSITPTPISCAGLQDGQLSVSATGGSGAFDYQLDGGPFQGANTFQNLDNGTYTLTARDAQGCTRNKSVTLPEPDTLQAQGTPVAVSCVGQSNGSVNLTATGGTPPYSYQLDGGGFQPNAEFNGLAAGTYSFSVQDQQGCTYSDSIQITAPAPLTASSASDSVSCFGAADGQLKVSAQGGNGGYSYQLNSGSFQSDSIFAGLAAGGYTVTVKDAAGCQTSLSGTIEAPDSLTVQAAGEDADYPQDNGRVWASAAGGTPPYTYTWSTVPTLTGDTLSNRAPASYSVTVQDQNGCVAEDTVRIDYKLTLDVTVSNATCGSSDGKILTAGKGGQGPYAYQLNGGGYASDSIFDSLAAGTYTVQIRDSQGEVDSSIVAVNNLGAPSLSLSSSPPSCYGDSNGLIEASASGNAQPFTYKLNSGSFQPDSVFTGLSPSTYTVTVADQNGCQASQTLVLGQPDSLQATLTTTAPSCFGGADGELIVQATGANGAYQYALNGGSFGPSDTFSGLSDGTYQVVVQDSAGCSDTANTMLAAPDSLQLSFTTDSVSCPGSTDGVITAAATGGNGGYQYALNGGVATANPAFDSLGTGTYNITVTDAQGCSTTDSVALAAPAPLQLQATVTDATCANQADGEVTLSATGGNGGYSYRIDNGSYQASPVFDSLAADSYDFTLRDSAGCMDDTANVMINEPMPVQVSASHQDLTCYQSTDGKIVANAQGGTAPYSYSTDAINYQPGAVFSNLVADTFRVYVKDANGCTAQTDTVLLEQPDSLQFQTQSQAPQCSGSSNGAITLKDTKGGTKPYMFRLNNGPQQADSSFTGLGGGSYQVQVIDAQGCTATDSVQLSTPAPIQLFAHTDSLTCATSADGQILVDSLQNAAGTPEYRLNGGPYQLAGTFTGLTEGTYYLEVKDSSGCVRGDSLTVHAPDTLQLSNIAKQRPLCHADTNGQLIVQQTQGGTAPYGYSLDGAPFQNDSSFANLADGAYQLVVKDFYGCRDTANVQLNAPDSLVIQSLQKQAVSCAGAANGQITINSVTGGSGSYAYALDTSAAQPGNTFSGLAGASYMVTVQDTNGCSDTSTVTVPEPDSLQLVMWSKQDLSCYGQNSGQITADSVQGGTGSYAYALNGAPFQSNASFTGLSGGSYTLRVRDQNNCRDSVTVQVLEPDSISINLNAAGPACFGESSGSIAVSASGGKGAFRYSLNGNAFQPDSLFDSLGVGNYLVQVEDSAGCTQTRSLQLSQPQPLTVIAQGGTTPSGQAQGIATASAQGGTTPYSFSWDTAPVSTGDSIGGLAAGTYSVTVTDANGCEAEDTAIVDPLTDRPARSTPVPSLSLHPNPARDVLHLQFQGLDTRAPIQLRLIDAAGQTVLRRQVAPRKDATVQLPLRELAQGVYSLQVSSGSWQATRRVLIRR